MLLHSIIKILEQQFPRQESVKAKKKAPPPEDVRKDESFAATIEAVKTPASAATRAAAAEAKGMKKIELEIAAAAGLLRPMSPVPPQSSGRSDQSFDGLLKTIRELKEPEKIHNIDLFK